MRSSKKYAIAVVLVIMGVLIGVRSILFPVSPIDNIGAGIASWTAARGEAFQNVVRFITALGDKWTVISLGMISIVMAAISAGGVSKKLMPPVMGMLGVWLLNELIKATVARDRPIIPWLIDNASGHSFPSGHAMNSMGCLIIMAMTLPMRYRRIACVFAFVLSILIGMSRVGLGVHYLSDVLAGWCFGLAFAFVYSALLSSRLVKRGINAAGRGI